ncbi:hypothetical protein LWC34_28650 [Kibdelosporangium philippinense]|uniref:Lipoprotein LprG n=1 Tax=Kibdelosporangium philippinense TaxID=211113 RepID=A0ABS8ZGT8_9PSEU|nr:hypothetical protein [Kibdelosporangium philippinense]MCE7006767.1 hypothetical protein [Kibdelosporangium philippinense]
MRTRVGVIVAAALCVLGLAGCGTAAVPGSPLSAGAAGQPVNADPKALIANAAKTTRDELSCKVEAKLEFKGQSGLGGWTSTGAFDFKSKRSKVESVMDMGGKKMTMNILSDGDALYMRTATEGGPAPRWSKTDLKQLEASLGQLGGGTKGGGVSGDPMRFIDEIKEIADVTPDGTENVRGVATTRYNVTVDPAKIPADDMDTSGIPADASSAMKLFVDSKGRLARFWMSMSGDGEGGSMTWDFYDYGVPVKIDIPAPTEVDGN